MLSFPASAISDTEAEIHAPGLYRLEISSLESGVRCLIPSENLWFSLSQLAVLKDKKGHLGGLRPRCPS